MLGKNVEFVTRFYGERLLPLLLVSLESLQTQEPDVAVKVFVSDVSQESIDLLQRAFPGLGFNLVGNIEKSLRESHAVRASRKFTIFEYLLKNSDNSDYFTYIFDCDLIFRKAIIDELLGEWDLLVTLRSGKWPLNSGLVGIQHNPLTHEFVSRVSRINSEILSSSSMSELATQKFGGPDQAAYSTVLKDYGIRLDKVNREKRSLHLASSELRVETVPCGLYNAHYLEHISDQSRVIHLKSGWQQLILGERGYTKSFPKALAQPIVEEFRSYLRAVLERVPEYRRSRVFRSLGKVRGLYRP